MFLKPSNHENKDVRGGVVYLEKKEGQRPPHRNICVRTHFLRSRAIFLHTMLAIRGGLMLLFNESHL